MNLDRLQGVLFFIKKKLPRVFSSKGSFKGLGKNLIFNDQSTMQIILCIL